MAKKRTLQDENMLRLNAFPKLEVILKQVLGGRAVINSSRTTRITAVLHVLPFQ